MNFLIEIIELECDQTKPELPNLVTAVAYMVQKERDGKTVTGHASQLITYQSDNDFIPFDELDRETVMSWLDLDIDQIDAELNAELDKLINPEKIVKFAPWVNIEGVNDAQTEAL